MIDFHPQQCGTLHFIGIGGIGMSGIAEALQTLGYTVQGSDASAGYNTDRLIARGIRVMIGHDSAHITTESDKKIAAVIVSSAIKPGNPELLAARALRIPIVRRADMLAEIMRHKKCISVAGTHGKTTTTSMVGAMLDGGGFNPTIINGGIIHAYGTTTRMGTGEIMVVESDESDGSFMRLPTTIAVVTNIDPEHMEHYGSFDAVRVTFRNFIENIPFYGFAVVCADHAETKYLADTITDRRVFTYGINSDNADTIATNVTTTMDGATFDVTFGPRITGGAPETITEFHLPMMGIHNVSNALVPLTIGRVMDMTETQMKNAMNGFQGVKRRFTKTGTTSNGITVIDDYAHHPVEIRATLAAARQAASGTNGRVIAVMQPHRYSRLASLFPEFCAAFDDADHVIVTDVYAAGEGPIDGISGAALADGIAKQGHKAVTFLTTVDIETNAPFDASRVTANLARIITPLSHPGDIILCMGAGSITSWAHALPEALLEPNTISSLVGS